MGHLPTIFYFHPPVSSQVTYVDVILPLALPQAYTYAVPIDIVDFVKLGQRVIVQFGKNRYYSAIVKNIHHNKPVVDAKLIEGIADELPIVTETQLTFWRWMSEYYMCTEGEVMNAALPSGLKISSETKIKYNESYDGDFESLSEDEFLIVQALRAQTELKVPQVQDLLKKKNVYPLLKTLFNLGIAISSEELIEKFKPKTETYVKLNPTYEDEERLKELFDELGRAHKQVELLLAFTQLGKKTKYIRKSELLLLAKVEASVLKRLVDRKVFEEFKMEISRLGNLQSTEVADTALSADQQRALTEINQFLNLDNGSSPHTGRPGGVVLLHGVTGSGKTNIYIEKIKEMVAQGKQVIYILPEIALTAQIINRVRKVFGKIVGIYHSKFNQNERVEIWNKVLQNEYKIVIGARSAVFLPYQDLGLVIVDEEHDSALKQFNPSPRYNARDASIVLAGYFNAKVLLGTATPSIETNYNCEKGKYGLVKLTTRYSGVEMPRLELANTREFTKRKQMNGNFTKLLIDEVNVALHNKEQVILFINRRGFANYQVCRTCNYTYKCKNCDVSLTYHKFSNQLVCHYCGYFEKVFQKCKNCGAIDLDIVGMGTEKIEDEIAELFPAAKVGRLDYDSTRTKHGHSAVISQFENRELDILVGTQMVTKGLDFDHVSLVGIINADQLLHYPDFRANERGFQLITQVSGRAGRKNKAGKVIVQTAEPMHPIIQESSRSDYKGMYKRELIERRQFGFPPYLRIIQITLQHKTIQGVAQGALYLVNEFRKHRVGLVLGPATPFISKVNNNYIREALIKCNPNNKEITQVKQALQKVIDTMKTIPELKSVTVIVNVDP